jgi:endogenous inhibitor of DNA gyrase (YacG/DUF329 family)
LIDLGAWVNEEYTVPGEPAAVPENAEQPNGAREREPDESS